MIHSDNPLTRAQAELDKAREWAGEAEAHPTVRRECIELAHALLDRAAEHLSAALDQAASCNSLGRA